MNRPLAPAFSAAALFLAFALAAPGCSANKKNPAYFTSGNRQADQRAEQRMAKSTQLKDAGNGPSTTPQNKSLYERLGGQQGLHAIVDDFVNRAVADPRVNWDRKGVHTGGFLGMGGHSEKWNPTAQNLGQLKDHLVQFLALASGGPSQYQGRDIKQVHKGMNISNPEFDAAIGDMKATLDKLQIATAEQKELLAIMESTRPEIVEKR